MRLISDEALAVVTIWQEARGEPHEGKVAVGEVIRNRMKLGKRPRSVAEVVLEPWQFSGFNTRDRNRTPSMMIDDEDPVVVECRAAWILSESSDLIRGATLYFNPHIVQPAWASHVTFAAEIGNHRFYRET